jgi:uncharacterized cofD-like protein
MAKRKASKRTKKIVCLGGGNAMPKTVLAGLKKEPVKLSVICAMLDSGGSSGRLRKEYNIVSPGDIRRSFLALANSSPATEKLFNFRFKNGVLKGHNFANLLITALELSCKSYKEVIKEMEEILKIKHKILPVTLDKSNLYAVLENGKTIKGETNIDIPRHDGKLKIKKVFLKPEAKAYPDALREIKKADLIVIGPGDLYSSIAQILLTKGISEAVNKSKAKKAYVCNLMEKYGETNGFKVSDFSGAIEKMLKGSLDYVIYNTKKASLKNIKKYKKEHPELLGQVKFKENLDSKKFIGADLLAKNKFLVHSPKKLAKIILKIA